MYFSPCLLYYVILTAHWVAEAFLVWVCLCSAWGSVVSALLVIILTLLFLAG